MTAPVLSAPTPDVARTAPKAGLLDPVQLVRSLPDAFAKLDPRTLVRNPVMFVVESSRPCSPCATQAPSRSRSPSGCG